MSEGSLNPPPWEPDGEPPRGVPEGSFWFSVSEPMTAYHPETHDQAALLEPGNRYWAVRIDGSWLLAQDRSKQQAWVPLSGVVSPGTPPHPKTVLMPWVWLAGTLGIGLPALGLSFGEVEDSGEGMPLPFSPVAIAAGVGLLLWFIWTVVCLIITAIRGIVGSRRRLSEHRGAS